MNIQENLKKAMELINSQKEDISKRKQQILIAETRREENLKALEKDYQELRELGVEPADLETTIESKKKELEVFNLELENCIKELEEMQFGTI